MAFLSEWSEVCIPTQVSHEVLLLVWWSAWDQMQISPFLVSWVLRMLEPEASAC
jgi:hypothetical protein